MFILVMMSHGTVGNVITDSNNQPIALVDIQDLLSPKKFPAMEGKPKVMIVQACSGGKSLSFFSTIISKSTFALRLFYYNFSYDVVMQVLYICLKQ